jgi:hypothetical protein
MTRRRVWTQQRSEHARVLESLEAVISHHPAGTAARSGAPRPMARAGVQLGPNVVDLDARRALVRSAPSGPYDAA